MEREDCPHLDIQQAGDGGAHQAKCDRESAYNRGILVGISSQHQELKPLAL
jgi:hypothetical protein